MAKNLCLSQGFQRRRLFRGLFWHHRCSGCQCRDCTDEYSIFALRLRPTFDFQQEILSMGSDVEVLAPDWFREDTAERVKAMWDKYRNKCE